MVFDTCNCSSPSVKMVIRFYFISTYREGKGSISLVSRPMHNYFHCITIERKWLVEKKKKKEDTSRVHTCWSAESIEGQSGTDNWREADIRCTCTELKYKKLRDNVLEGSANQSHFLILVDTTITTATICDLFSWSMVVCWSVPNSLLTQEIEVHPKNILNKFLCHQFDSANNVLASVL